MVVKPLWRPLLVLILALAGAALACQQFARPASQPAVVPAAATGTPEPGASPTATLNPLIPPTRPPDSPLYTPTPDPPHPLPTPRTEAEQYTVQSGDTLALIAQRYGISYQMIVEANEIDNPNLIDVGLELTVPPPDPDQQRPDLKIIPDSELVYGPYSAYFDVQDFIERQGGYLSQYTEELAEDDVRSGAEIVQQVALDFSVNPRLLLAVLEYQSGWLTQAEPDEETLPYPLGYPDPAREGLYLQLAYAANELNRGYYLWQVHGIATWVLGDGTVLLPSPLVNAGTAGVQQLFSRLYGRPGFEQAVSAQGLLATYSQLFGYPFDYTLELLPAGLAQPELLLPFQAGEAWAFTGGPHGSWGNGSAWGALDFAPPGEVLGCVPSDAWVTAMADGVIVRAGEGAVLQDLDGDGLEQTGWALLYMHIESRDRVAPGTFVRAGERIGHPSCEGGFSTGTHLHVARKYNGQWLAADGPLPFSLGEWVSAGAGREYDGYLISDGKTVEAWNGRSEENEIQH